MEPEDALNMALGQRLSRISPDFNARMAPFASALSFDERQRL
jgi:hypothetical protein